MGYLTPIAALAAVFIAACGSDDGGGDAAPDVADTTAVETDATTEVDDDVEVAETVTDSAPTTDDAAVEVEVVEVDTSLSEVVVDRNCEFDARLTNGRSHELRCKVCRDAVGFVRVRAELLWTGTYDAPASAPTACEAFPDEACKANVAEVEALLCGNLSTGAMRVVWSDVVDAIVGSGEALRVVDMRGPLHRILLADVWADPADALLEPEAAFEPGSWLVGPPGERESVTVEEHFRQTACPIGRFAIGRRGGAIGPCDLAAGLIGKDR